jgi:Lon protease-like protein
MHGSGGGPSYGGRDHESRCVPCGAMEELGLFPLGIVLLPGERVPLHIFEPRYRELIGECIEHERAFGLVFADEDGVRELGTRAHVDEVLERFDDGRLNIVVRGGERFRVEKLTRGRSFLTALVAPVDDDGVAPSEDSVSRAAASFRALASAAEADASEVDEADDQLSFRLAGQVELAADAKQQLLELRSEQERLELVAQLLDAVRAVLIATRELGERAKTNGSRLT